MWTVVYIASNRTQAEKLKDSLCNEGVLANIRLADLAMQGESMYEILVLESEATEAQEIICQNHRSCQKRSQVTVRTPENKGSGRR